MRAMFPARAALPILFVACSDAGAPEPLVVDHVELSASSVRLPPNGSTTLTAVPRTASGSVVPGRTVTWTSSDDAIATVAAGQINGIAFGVVTVTATVDGKSADASVAVVPTEAAHLAAAWRMESFDGKTLPAAYALFYDEPVGDRIIGVVEIRLDSARKLMAADRTYQRGYCFTELHDDVPMFRYCWGDHGLFTLGADVPVSLTLTSEYIQNLTTPGHVTTDGRLALNEELWIGEARHATIWARSP